MAGDLTVVRAGAGTGKTHRVCEEIAAAIARGLDPALVLATTFTRRAAAELKGRVLTRILTDPRLPPAARTEKAERLELAAIGTVHSVGHRFLSRHALALGLSPLLSVMEEGREERHLRRLLALSDGGDLSGLAEVARRLGIEEPRVLILDLLGRKRANTIPADRFRAQLLSGAERLCEVILGAAKGVEEGGPEDLYGAAEKALGKLAKVADETKTTAGAITSLRQLVDRRKGCWQDFVLAAKLGAGKRSGADGCLAEVRATGARVRLLAGLHADVRDFARRLADTVLALETAYETYKAERGLLDYTDLEVLFLRLLGTPSLEDDLRASISLVVVDEFQDTNPLQLAIFSRLSELATRSVWVGDAKQAIYGFRGTDSELLGQVFAAVPESSRERLPDNYRSQEGLVRLVGALFRPLFGEEATLRPRNPPAPRGVERWLLESKNRDDDATALAAGVRALVGEGVPAAKIAVLTRTNERARTLAGALATAGVPAALPLPGLFGTREGALVLAGLRLVADRFDGVAAATILHLLTDRPDRDPEWLSVRLREVPAGSGAPFGGHPLLAPLGAIDARCRAPSEVVSAVAGALDLPALLPSFGGASRRFQNLDAILAAARAYEQESRDLGVSATLSGLIAEFEDVAGDERDLAPAPRGTDAVTVVTFHSAKGLQWPVVILTDLDYDRGPDLFRPAVSGREAPLAGRAVRYWPWPFGRSGWGGALTAGSGLEDDALATPEGCEEVRRAEAEAARLLYVACTRAREKLVFAHRPGKCAWLSMLPDADTLLPPDAEPGEHPLPSLTTSFLLRRLPAAPPEPAAPAEEECWLAPRKAEPREHHPRFSPPSAADAVEVVAVAEPLPDAHPFPARTRPEKEAELGSAVHAYLAALPSLATAGVKTRLSVSARCLAGFGVEGEITPDALVSAGDRLAKCLGARFPGAEWRTEVAVIGGRASGGSWAGSVDLLLLLPDGTAVVIDHKTAPVPLAGQAAAARAHAGQLLAYREALASAGTTVRGLLVHFPLGGGIVRLG
jgi:ATP-dependent exoDNAse (exonuclease V) beta subunit